ncbi:MAG TPA: VWA domain-containing protein [Blastocatellia bacterium]
MNSRLLVAPFVGLSLVLGAFGQQPQQPAASGTQRQQEQSARKNQDEIVRISVTLVQVDVSVTDKKGRPVTDLRSEDFEIYEDGKRQQITNFSYISPERFGATEASPPAQSRIAKNPPLSPPVRLRPDQVRRTIALVVDDLTLTVESAPFVRQALKKFVDEQMQPGDLVAIIRTGAGIGALQMFTADKRILYAATERVRWSPSSSTLYTFAPVQTNAVNPNSIAEILHQETRTSQADALTKVPERVTDELDRFRQEVFSIGTLGALHFVVRALKDLPGRKSVVLFSEGLRIYNREQSVLRVRDALNNLTDLANRSSAVIYTMDAKGLQPLTMTAADDLTGDFGAVDDQVKWLSEPRAYTAQRRDEFFESQEGLNYLAQQTGGFFVRNTNDLNGGIRRALKDQESYYLIGFVPEESTFRRDRIRGFHHLKVKVNRPDVRVRTRSGFFGISDEEDRSLQKTLGQTLLMALASPFNSGDIELRLTSMLGVDPQKGPFVSSLLHIGAKGLTFAPEANGQRKASFEVAAFTFGDNGRVIDQSIRGYTIHMTEREYEHTLKAGIFYRVNLPIKKPGAYQLRTAVRDTASLKLGSANQFIEVPDLKKNMLTLSGLIVRGEPLQNASAHTAAQITSTTEGKLEEENPEASPAVRRFTSGMALEYACVVYKARLNKATGRPQLETQLRLFREGQQLFVGKVNSFDPAQQKDFSKLVVGGSLLLGKELLPGEYALQVTVTDKLAREESRIASQWIDFDIVK